MKILIKYFFIILVLASGVKRSLAQNITVDSLHLALKIAKQDTTKLRLLVQLSEECELTDILKYAGPAVELADKLLQEVSGSDQKSKSLSRWLLSEKARALNNTGFIYEQKGDIQKAIYYYKISLKISEEISDKEGIATLLNNMGLICYNQGDIHAALDYYSRSLKMREETGDKKGIANSVNNIGAIYTDQGDIIKALNYFARSLKIREEIGDKEGVAVSLNNIGSIYVKQGDMMKALDNYNLSLKIREELGEKKYIANSINNIGSVYYEQGNLIAAINYYRKSLKLYEELNDKINIASLLNNIGTIYEKQGNSPMTLDCYERSLKISEEIGDKKRIANSLSNIGGAYLVIANSSKNPASKQKNYRLALAHSLKSLEISKELGFPENIRDAERILYQIDVTGNNYAGAFEHYKQFIIYRDSINNQSTRKASIKSQLKYEYEKKEAVIKEQQEKERAVSEEQNHRQQIVIWSVACGLLLVIIFAGFVFRSLKTTREQKVIIEMKQKDILDSIHYAKRIQQSLLPNEKYMERQMARLLRVKPHD